MRAGAVAFLGEPCRYRAAHYLPGFGIMSGDAGALGATPGRAPDQGRAVDGELLVGMEIGSL
jgi:hypothetical protein